MSLQNRSTHRGCVNVCGDKQYNNEVKSGKNQNWPRERKNKIQFLATTDRHHVRREKKWNKTNFASFYYSFECIFMPCLSGEVIIIARVMNYYELYFRSYLAIFSLFLTRFDNKHTHTNLVEMNEARDSLKKLNKWAANYYSELREWIKTE
jgi:hypothetical protein